MELEIDVAWFEDGIIWERQKKKDKGQERIIDKTKSFLTNGKDMGRNGNTRQQDRALKERQRRRKRLKHHYF